MSLYWTNFQAKNTESINKDEKDLYRIRDYDDPKINKAKLVNKNFLFPHRDDQGVSDNNKLSYLTPSDPIWDTLTENERVENGLPSKFLFKMYSIQHTVLTGLALGKKKNLFF